jgi:ankyrin repeat protein
MKSFDITIILPTALSTSSSSSSSTIPVDQAVKKSQIWTLGRTFASSIQTIQSVSNSKSEVSGHVIFSDTTLDLVFCREKETVEQKESKELSTVVITDLLSKARPRKDIRLRNGLEIMIQDNVYSLLFATRNEKELFVSFLITILREKVTDQLDPYWLHKYIQGTLFSVIINATMSLEKDFRELCAYSISGRGRADSDDHDPLTDVESVMEDSLPRFDINAIDVDSGKTLLHIAASHSSSSIARLFTQILLEHGASSSSTDHDFQTPLHSATNALNADVVTLFLANGSQIDARDLLEQTPLDLILRILSEKTLVEEKALIAESIAKIFLSYGASVNEADGDGYFSIHHVARTCRPALVRALQKRSVNSSLRALVISNGGVTESFSALHIACGAEINNCDEAHFFISSLMIRALINIGCFINSPTMHSRSTPLHFILKHIKYARSVSNVDAIYELERAASVLCMYGARLDIPDINGIECLSMAKDVELLNSLETACKLFSESLPPLTAHAALPSLFDTDIAQFNDFGGDFKKKGISLSEVKVKLQEDSARQNCNGCELPFNHLSRRKHHCYRCGLLMCAACTTRKLKRTATSGDSDDDEAIRKGAFSIMMNLFTPPPPTTGTVSSGSVKLRGIRVCDSCWNICCAYSMTVVSEQEEWERQKKSEETLSRNMLEKPSNSDQRLALLGSKIEASKKEKNVDTKLGAINEVLDKNKNLLLERGQKLSRLDEKVADMSNHAKSFADHAEMIKRNAKSGWF